MDHVRDAMHRMTERMAGGWRGTRLLPLLAAALLPVAAAAQRPATASRPSSDASVRALTAELRDLQRRRSAAAERLERFAATLRTREPTPLVHDSLLLLVREHADLGTRAALVEARLSFRAVERRERDASDQRRIEVQRRSERVAQERRAGPEGWFGVSVREVPAALREDGRVLMATEYPRVVSVEPASPAARAGVQAGDRLVEIDGIDLRESAVDLDRLLRPGRTVPVRIARDGQLRDVRVAVTTKPRTFVSGVTVRVTTPDAETPRVSVRGAPPAPVRVSSPALAAPSPLTLFYRSPNVALLAGAEVVHLPRELRTTLDVRGGVLVVQVARGSLAERAGLRGGDVLLRANGRALSSPEVLHRVAAQAAGGESEVRLELLRDKRRRTVELKW